MVIGEWWKVKKRHQVQSYCREITSSESANQ